MVAKRKCIILSMAIGLWLLALVPRVISLGGFLTIDEIKWIEGAGQFTLALQSGDLAQTYWHFFPGITITWGETLTLWVGRLISGGDLATYVAAQVADPAHTIGLFRVSGALLTALFAPGAFLLGRRIWGEWAASLAGGLIALNPFLLAHSRIVNGDAGAAGLMFLSLLAFLWLWRGSGLRMAALSGGLGGLALLTKLPSPLIVPFIGLSAVVGWQRDRRTRFWLKALLIWGLAALLVFAVLWPAMWVNPLGTLQQMWHDAFEVGEAGEGHSTFYRGQVVDDPGWGFYPYAVAFRLTPVVLAGLLLLVLIFRRGSQDRHVIGYRLSTVTLIVYVLFIYVFSSLSPKKLDRYVMAVFPALDMLAAIGYAQISNIKYQTSNVKRQTSNVKRQISKLACWLLIVGVLAVAFVAPYFPYYLSYYNPLLGGIRRAVREVPIGWGEGLEEAAAWLNAQPDAKSLQVSAWYSDIFFPYFVGEHVSFSSSGKSQLAADYVVFYVNQVQRQKPYPALVRYLQAQEPAYTVYVKDVPWVWVYRAPGMQISMPDQVQIEGRAELLGFDVSDRLVRRGQEIGLRLYLRTLGDMPMNEAWQVNLHDANNYVIASGIWKPSNWEGDAILVHSTELKLPANLSSGIYSLGVVLWDESGGHQVKALPIPVELSEIRVIE
jgi:hypothetical protein